MLKRIVSAIAVFFAASSFAFAAVDLNKADQAALDSVKGIGPKMSKSILDERKKGGDFKDWADFEKRVKGVGEKSSDKLSKEGVTINGKSKSVANASKEAKNGKADVKEIKTEAKAEAKDMKQEAKEAKKEAKSDAKEVRK
ncbi:MAG: ComEA family DNA-binding protein [Burkholderiaceae bacterium]